MNKTKVQITLTPQEVTGLALNPLGYDVTRYVKFVVSREAYTLNENIPTFKMSKRLEKITAKAIDDYKKGRAKFTLRQE